MENPSLLVQTAKVLGITASTFLAGSVYNSSSITVPVMLQASNQLIPHLWKAAFDIGRSTAPPIAMTACVSYAYLAFDEYSNGARSVGSSKWHLYALAALSTMGVVGFTRVFMSDVNGKLLRIAASAVPKPPGGSGGEAKELVQQWAALNTMRAFFPLTGGLLGLYAALS
ncbi:MAG: hypothetical protein M1827_006503 [Pycnora praestabilis]|nr:MAG: hypothetical protein M1827_006503 [Pycnora praestabilis]